MHFKQGALESAHRNTENGMRNLSEAAANLLNQKAAFRNNSEMSSKSTGMDTRNVNS